MTSTNVHAQIQQKKPTTKQSVQITRKKITNHTFFQFVFGLTGTVILLSLNF